MKWIILFGCYFICNTIFSQYQFTLIGTAPSFLNGKKIYLVIWDTYSNNKFKREDSAVIKNLHFEFRGRIKKQCEEAFIMLKEKGNFFDFALDSGIIVMTIRPLPSNWPFYKNKLSNTFVRNSYSNIIHDSLRNLINHYYLNYGKPDKTNNGIVRLDTARSKELWIEELGIVQRHSTQFYSLIYLYKLLLERKKEVIKIRDIFNILPQALKSSELGQELSDKIIAIISTQVTHHITEFSINTVSGSTFFSNMLSGRVYLIAFGATWCKPCKENYPLLKELYRKYKDKGFEIVDINLDDRKVMWRKQIESFELNWVSVSELKKWEESVIVKKFGINYIPFYLLVNKEGIIIYNSSQTNDSEFTLLNKVISDNLE
jgi:thiol-disulfide isomerase/thioredoxin